MAELYCKKCNLALEPEKTEFIYLGKTFAGDVLRCPSCGLVYVPEEFAIERLARVERMMEDK
jgi:rubredoxin